MDRSFVRHRIADELGDQGVQVHLADVSFSLFRRRIDATGVVISRPGRATLAVPRVVASGIPIFAGGEVRAVRRLTLDGPILYLHPGPDDGTDAGRDEDGVRGGGPPAREPRPGAVGRPGNAALRIEQLHIGGGTILAWRPRATGGPRQVLVRDLRLDGRALAFDGQGRVSGSVGDLSLRTGEFSRTRYDGLTRFVAESLQASAADSSFLISGLDLAPTTSDEEFFRRLDERHDRIRATASKVTGRGFDLAAWTRRDVRIRAVEFDTVDVDVLTNRRLPAARGDPRLPIELIRSFEGDLRVDTIRVSGRIVYNEIPERRAAATARIAFEGFDARLCGISTAPDAPSMRVDASMVLFEAPASIRIEIPYDSPTYRMEMSGRVGALDLTRINSLTVPLQGIEVQDGHLAAMRFDVTVDGHAAGGTVWAAYRDLDVQMVNRETGEGGLFDDIKSFLAKTFVLRGSNMPGENRKDDARPGAVEYYVRDADPFFTRVWAPIRSGLMAVARG